MRLLRLPRVIREFLDTLRAVSSSPAADDDSTVVAQYHLARCDGCCTLPYITFIRNTSAHIMCVFPKCHAPRFTSTEHDLPLDVAVGEWNSLNNTNASFNNIEVFDAQDLSTFERYLKARETRTAAVTTKDAMERFRRQMAARGSRDLFNRNQ